jgi:hypothetical protein
VISIAFVFGKALTITMISLVKSLAASFSLSLNSLFVDSVDVVDVVHGSVAEQEPRVGGRHAVEPQAQPDHGLKKKTVSAMKISQFATKTYIFSGNFDANFVLANFTQWRQQWHSINEAPRSCQKWTSHNLSKTEELKICQKLYTIDLSKMQHYKNQ